MKKVYVTKKDGTFGTQTKWEFEPEDDEYIISEVRKGTQQKDIAAHFAKWCSRTVVCRHIHKICNIEDLQVDVHSSRQRISNYGRTTWTKAQDEQLRSYYPDMPNSEIALLMDKSHSAISRRAILLGLRKSKEYLQKVISKNVGTDVTIRSAKLHKDLCVGRFCPRRGDCKRYNDYMAALDAGEKIDPQITLNRGRTTDCIKESIYTYFIVEKL